MKPIERNQSDEQSECVVGDKERTKIQQGKIQNNLGIKNAVPTYFSPALGGLQSSTDSKEGRLARKFFDGMREHARV